MQRTGRHAHLCFRIRQKTMKNKLKSLFSAGLTAIIGLLGFNSCIGLCMYGQPHADFTFKGTVKDSGGKPVKDIRVIVDYYETGYSERPVQQLMFSDTLYTDNEGIALKTRELISGNVKTTVTLTDLDGEDNGGEFKELKVENLESRQVKKGDGDWYQGAFVCESEFTLEKKAE